VTESGEKKIYGRTINGLDITDELIEQYVAEAEAGYDLDRFQPVRGRPRMTKGPAGRVLRVRLDADLRAAVAARASRDGTSAAEIVRRALRSHFGVD